MLRKIFFAGLAALVFAANSYAGTVSLFVETAGNNWQLFAEASPGDNAGIASYNIPLLNIQTLTNEGPFYQLNSTNFQPAGFSELRVPSTDNDPTAKTVFGGQKTIPTPTPNIVYGFGQTGGTLPGAFVGAAPNKNATGPYGAHLLLASGTFSGTTPAPDFQSPSMSISLFNNSSGTATSAATVVPGTTVIPEPASFALVGIAMVSGFGMIRRRRAA